MNVKEEQTSARQRVDLYRSRYAGRDNTYDPIHFAIEWQKVFESSQPDVGRVRTLVAAAIEKKNDFDISFFTFCTHMEKILEQMIKDSLIQ